jgi:phage tail-like protein
MTTPRINPYGAFNYLVQLGDGLETDVTGGFSEVTGLGNEVKYSEYRNGNDAENHVRKVANTNTTDDITLKRGLISDVHLFTWIKNTRRGDFSPQTVTITLLDEAKVPVCAWVLAAAQPKKWVGPSLSAKGGGEVAMEELHLVAESVEFQTV